MAPSALSSGQPPTGASDSWQPAGGVRAADRNASVEPDPRADSGAKLCEKLDGVAFFRAGGECHACA